MLMRDPKRQFLKGDNMRKRHIVLFLFVLLAALMLPTGSSAQIAVGVSVRIGPPALPVYAQPICPGPGYLWTPGYWGYGPNGYYWVPGTWVMAPAVGLLWTPGYWGWGGGGYLWHAGYWGPHVGFYGGINYGFGYGGVGFVGGRWDHGVFAYNTAVMHVNTTIIHNTYIDRTVVRDVTVNRVSFNGGAGGINARPTRQEMAYEHERHVAATDVQMQHEHAAASNRTFLASENHGHPAVAATARPGEFSGHDVAASRGAPNSFHPPAHGNGTDAATHSNNAAMHSSHEGGSAPAHMDNASHGGGHNNPKPEAKSNSAPHEEHKPEKPRQ
jgi:WXXGXW repeat (2 copies)